MNAALIMAGGSGERFWPLSTKEKPKQLLKLFSEKSMLRQTVDRILPLIPAERIFIATNTMQEKALKEDIDFIPEENIIIEPAFKDTAAAIGYGTYYINQYVENPEIVVLASDHLIMYESVFRKNVETALDEAKKGSVITFGIKPCRPETGYGYIETKSSAEVGNIYNVEQFHEKPKLEVAEKYVEAGNFLWNSGMFIFSSKTIINAFENHLNKHFNTLETIKSKFNKKIVGVEMANLVKDDFEKFEKISVDFGIMEKIDNLKVIAVDFGWNDVGDYNALFELYDHNMNNTVEKDAKLVELDSKNNIVVSNNKRKVAILGLENIIVAETEEGLLICDRSKSQEIKKIINK
jgi:mannose-1-phosphate guanylyltransferase